MKRVLFLFISLIISFLGFSQNTHVPDDNFERALIDLGFDSGPLDNYVLTSNINTVTFLNIINNDISDLTGIQDFTALRTLTCYDNKLTNLDLSKNIALTALLCFSNQLTSLDLSNNKDLILLNCDSNKITGLSLEQNLKLERLFCDNNQLTNLDLTQNLKLERLSFSFNKLSNIDLSKNILMQILECSNNELTNLDLAYNIQIEEIACRNNQLLNINVVGNKSLRTLRCENNFIQNLDLNDNEKLVVIECDNNLINELDLSKNAELGILNIGRNNLSNLDVSNNLKLISLRCSYNQLIEIDVRPLASLQNLSCSANKITSLDLSNNPNLRYVSCRFSENLENFNIQNGNNPNLDDDTINSISGFWSTNNPKLSCIQVDDTVYSETNWTNVDAHTLFSENCSTLSNEEFNQFEFALYPNPTNQKVNVDIQQETDFIIYNLSGQQVSSGKLNIRQNKINLSNLKGGIYLLNLKNETINITRKLIKL